MTVAKDIILLSEACEQYAESVARDIADRDNDPRSMCLWNIHNRMMISGEIMTFYERSWGSDDFPEVDDDTVGELVERVMVVTRDLYVDVVSAIEKAVKDSVAIIAIQRTLWIPTITATLFRWDFQRFCCSPLSGISSLEASA